MLPYLHKSDYTQITQQHRQNTTQAEVREAARQANALEFIERFPEGFDTIIGEGGVALSGGQRCVDCCCLLGGGVRGWLMDEGLFSSKPARLFTHIHVSKGNGSQSRAPSSRARGCSSWTRPPPVRVFGVLVMRCRRWTMESFGTYVEPPQSNP